MSNQVELIIDLDTGTVLSDSNLVVVTVDEDQVEEITSSDSEAIAVGKAIGVPVGDNRNPDLLKDFPGNYYQWSLDGQSVTDWDEYSVTIYHANGLIETRGLDPDGWETNETEHGSGIVKEED